MKKIYLAFFAFIAFLFSGNLRSQTLTDILEDSIYQFSSGDALTIIGSGTNFMGGNISGFLHSGNDTVYPYFIDGPYLNDTVVMHFDIPCNKPLGSWDLTVYNDIDGYLVLTNAILVGNGLNADLEIHNVKCNGDFNGSIICLNGGMARGGPMFNYYWYPGGETDFFIENLGPGTYSLVLTDMYEGCVDSVGIVLIDPPVLTVDYQAINANCGQQDGMMYIESINGGIAPYQINWGPGQWTTDTVNNLMPGNYSLYVTDSFECVFSDYFQIAEQLTLDVATVNTTCASDNGSATLTLLNGTGPFEIFWSNGDYNTLTADTLSPGQYAVQATDAGGCYGATVFNIIPTNGPQITSIVTGEPTCNGVEDASIDITVTGGTAPYSFQWSNGATTEDLANVPSGIYEVTISDNTGCSVSSCISIQDNTRLRIDYASGYNASCGMNDGWAEVWYTGGVEPVTIQWDTAAGSVTGNNAYGLAAGFYSVILTDNIGCTDSTMVVVSDFTGPSFSVDSSNAANCELQDGNVFVTPGGGTSNCVYVLNTYDSYGDSWNGGYLTVLIDGFVYNTYAAAGYGTDFYIPVPENSTIELVYTSGSWENENTYQLYDCLGNLLFGDGPNPTTGSVYTGTAPAPPPVTVNWTWSNGELGEDLVNVGSGTYQYTLTDQNGCITNALITVDGIMPGGQDICMVTVDSLLQRNLVVWEKAVTTEIDHYNIYREACGDINGMVFVGAVPYDSLSQFVDVAANPQVRSWRYRMTAVDNCGTESDVSPVHKTVHLSVTHGANNTAQLQWDNYQGFSFTEQFIWRYHSSTGWICIDTVASTVHQYYDSSPLAADTVDYVIEIAPPAPCVSTRAENHNYTRSNRGGITPPDFTGKEEPLLLQIITAHPNPSSGIFTLQISLSKASLSRFMIYDASGKLVRSQQLNLGAGVNNYDLSLSDMANGMYQVVFMFDDSTGSVRLMKN